VIQSNENLKDPNAQEQLVSGLLSMPMPIGGTSQRQILGPVHEPKALMGEQAAVTERELKFHPLYNEKAEKITLVSSEGIPFRVEKAILSKHRYV
jgi:hypothetical protein